MATTRCAHTLKGVAGNIGAKKVQGTAAALEQACQGAASTEQLEPLLAAVEDELSLVIAALATLNKATISSAAGEQHLDKNKFRQLLVRLRALLEDDDTDAIDVIDELQDLPGIAVHSAMLKQLTTAVESYDFDTALQQLNALQ